MVGLEGTRGSGHDVISYTSGLYFSDLSSTFKNGSRRERTGRCGVCVGVVCVVVSVCVWCVCVWCVCV